jgi:hypothetical protein
VVAGQRCDRSPSGRFSAGGRGGWDQSTRRIARKKSTFERRSAAFAFDDLTERLDGRPPEIVATPEMLAATKEALPTLAQALNDMDDYVRLIRLQLNLFAHSGPSVQRWGRDRALHGL